MTLVEAGIRGGAITLFLLTAALLFRDLRHRPSGLYAVLLNIGVAAYVLESTPLLARQATLWMAPIHWLSFGNQVLFWLFASAAFDDRYERSWRRELLWPLLGGFGLFNYYWPWDDGWWIYNGLSLVFAGLAVRAALAGRSEDLVESRRRFRLVTIVVIAAYIAALVISSMVFRMSVASQPMSLPNALALLTLAAWIAFSRMTLIARGSASMIDEPEPPRPETEPDPQEFQLLERLKELMEVERLSREPGLSVASLAARLGIPDYRLRRLINGRLGHRNFTSFVNGYRLEEAKAALADPAQAAVPVLTIALDAGFQSIGPFNRAFKAATGVTPTEYRRLTPSPAASRGNIVSAVGRQSEALPRDGGRGKGPTQWER